MAKVSTVCEVTSRGIERKRFHVSHGEVGVYLLLPKDSFPRRSLAKNDVIHDKSQ